MRVLATGGRADILRRTISQELCIPAQKLNWTTTSRDFEKLCIEERRFLFLLAGHLLADWPNNIVRHCKVSGVWSSSLLRDFAKAPFFFSSLVERELFRNKYSPSNREIKAAWHYLCRSSDDPTPADLSRLLGCRDIKRKRKGIKDFLHKSLGRKSKLKL
jgi:hypothetical protein